MPRNTREWAHRKLQQANQNIDWSGTHLQAVKERYQADHPEISKALETIQELLIMAQDTIVNLRKSF